MILLKNQLFENEQFIATIQKINNSVGLKPKVAYWFNRFAKELNDRAADYGDIRSKLVRKHGMEVAGQPGKYEIGEDQMVDFLKDMDELNSEKVRIKMDVMEYPEGLALSPVQMSLVEDIFDFSALEE